MAVGPKTDLIRRTLIPTIGRSCKNLFSNKVTAFDMDKHSLAHIKLQLLGNYHFKPLFYMDWSRFVGGKGKNNIAVATCAVYDKQLEDSYIIVKNMKFVF